MTDHQLSELCRLVDEQSDAFERAWAEGNQPSIADFLDAVPAEIRQPVFVELLATEMELTARAGQWPDIEAYETQFPAYGEEILQAVDEFHSWAQSSDTVDEGLKSRLAAVDQDTKRQALETHQWTPADEVKSASQTVGIPPADGDFPRRIGRYEVLRKLGQGGMGTVLLARDSVLDRRVALKLPHFETREDDQAILRFHREARAMATVQHPNLCPIHDVGEHEGHPYITMAYIDGKSLAEEIAAAGPLETVRAVQLVRQLALAMQAVHEAGVLHRDLKPSNVMIDQQGEPHITDFGLASRDRQSEAELTQSGTVIGSPAYMAPEQVSGVQAAFGPHTDVYALGVILYQLLCGRRPFEGAGLAVLGQITSGKLPTPPSELADVDAQLEAICLKAMALDVDKRFQSAQELADSLQAWLRHADAPIAMRAGKRAIFAVASCALLLCVGVAAFLLFGTSPRPKLDDVNTRGGRSLGLPVPATPDMVHFVDSGQEFEPDNSTAVAAGDLDRDGDVDVIVTRDGAPNQVWLNDGAGHFSMHQELDPVGFGDVTLGDLDGDGDLDAAFLGANPDLPGAIWLNDGHGTFTNTGQSLAGKMPWEIELADLDNDADLDVVVMDRKGPNLIFRNDGSGHLSNTEQALGTGNSASVKIGDLDGDGDNDLFVGNYSRQPNTVWFNDGKGVFADSGQKLGNSSTHAVAILDLDLDGDLDVFAANVDATNTIWVNDGAGTFSAFKPPDSRQTSSSIGVADLNDDRRNDLFIVNGFRGTPEPGQIMLSTGQELAFDMHYSSPVTATGIALADFDNDGDVDAFVATFHDTPNRLWLNQASSAAD